MAASDETLNRYPSLRTLFGDLDYCECRHCQSVLGPAAYLVDLLHFLQRSPLTPNADGDLSPANYVNLYLKYDASGTVLGALLQRRPDLADLQLSCENTDTEIPYIDLVLEILENAVALPMAVVVEGIDIDAEFSNGNVPTAVGDALHQTDIEVGTDLRVTPDLHLGTVSLGAIGSSPGRIAPLAGSAPVGAIHRVRHRRKLSRVHDMAGVRWPRCCARGSFNAGT